MKTNAGTYPNIFKVRGEWFAPSTGVGWVTYIVDRHCNDMVLVMELGRHAIETYGAVIEHVYQTDSDVGMQTENTDHVSVRMVITQRF